MRRWINLGDLSAARKPDRWDDRGYGVDRQRGDAPRIRRLDDGERQNDRPDDRDEQCETNSENDGEDVDRR